MAKKNNTKLRNRARSVLADNQSSNTVATPKQILVEAPSYSNLINVSEETNSTLLDKLQPIADKHQATLLAFIAPYFGKKTSPVDFIGTSISFWEELGIEEAVNQIKKSHSHQKLFLLVESPGGLVGSSYKIAKKLRSEFEEIISFVPHVAASGGCLITLTGNEVVMNDMANLGPIDVQVPYGGTRVSVNSMTSALARLLKYFETKRPEQVPYPYRALVDKLDPIIYDDWSAETDGMMEYAVELLTKAKYDQESIVSILTNFIITNKPHDFVITKDKAKTYGVNINDDDKYKEELNCMKWWLKEYMLKEGTDHYIRYVLPKTPQQLKIEQNPK